MQAKFECIFREFEACAAFHYLRSFRRIRVDFESHLSASKAKVSMDNTPFGETVINCYFVQVRSSENEIPYLLQKRLLCYARWR